MADKTNTIKTKLTIDGEKAYKDACKDINSTLKLISSEMKLMTAQFAENATSTDALKSKQELLQKTLDEQAKKVAAAEAALKTFADEGLEGSKAFEKMETTLNLAKAAMQNTENQLNTCTEELRQAESGSNQYETALSKVDTTLSVLGAELQTAASSMGLVDDKTQSLTNQSKLLSEMQMQQKEKVEILSKAYDDAATETGEFSDESIALKLELEKAKQELSSTASQLDSVEKEMKDTANATDSATGKFDKFKSAASAVGTACVVLGKTLVAVGASLAVLAGSAINVGMGYEAQMSTVAAISGATSEEMEQLSVKAKEMGAATQFSAKESAQAFEYMAMAGWNAGQMIDGLEGIMYAAGASGEDLAKVADIVTDGLTAFGLAADQSGRFADVLAAASSSSNTNIGLMGETFKYVAPLAGAMGYSIEDTALAIGLMANSGIKGSQAGTALRTILTACAKDIKVYGNAFGELTIQTQNADGSMRDLDGVLRDLRNAFDQMTEAEKAVAAEDIAGKTGMSGLLAIVNAAEDDFNALAESINNSAGAAEHMNSVRIDNLAGDLKLLESAVQGLGIEFYESIQGPLREVTQEGIGYIEQLTDAFTENGLEGMVLELGNVVSDIAVKIVQYAPKMVEAASTVLQSFLMGLIQEIPAITQSAVEIIETLLNGIISMTPMLIEGAANIIIGLADGLAQALPQLIPATIQMVITVVENLIESLPLIMDAAIALIEGFAEGLLEAIPIIIEALPEIILNIVEFLSNSIPTLINTGVELFTSLIGALPEIISTIVAALPEIIDSIVSTIIGSIPLLIQAGIDLLVALVEALPEIITAIVAAIPEIITAIVDAFIGNIDLIILAGVQLFVALIANLPTIILEIVKAVPQIISGIVEAFSDSMPSITEIGSREVYKGYMQI